MTYAWDDNQPTYGIWGFSTGGEDDDGNNGMDPFFGTQTPITDGFHVCRPRAGTGHFLRHIVTFFDGDGAIIPVDVVANQAVAGGGDMYVDLYDTDYLSTADPSYPLDYPDRDVAPYILPPASAASYVVCVIDQGPYDGTGTTTEVTPDYDPYTDADTAWANVSACLISEIPNLEDPNLTGAGRTGRRAFTGEATAP